MTGDDIMRMAREAKEYAEYVTPQGLEWFDTYNERFAALVAAAEREACANVCEQGLPIASSLNALDDMEMWGEKFATAIRARSNA